jgi:DNA transformation protein
MATSAGTADFLLEQLAPLGTASLRRMFGEYCLYISGAPVGLVCDDQLYLKPTEAGSALCSPPREGHPYPGAKPHLLITADQWEDGAWLCQLVTVTAGCLPPPKPKAKAKAKTKAKSKSKTKAKR